MKKWGNAAQDAVAAEIKSMLEKGVFIPANPRRITKRLIRSFIFLKEKYDANGNFDRIKARLVAGGNEQDKSLYDDLSSPTCSIQSLFIVVQIAVIEGWIIVTMDVGTAYLNADIERDDIFILLDEETSRILISLDGSFLGSTNSKGHTIIHL
jgi:hypothetical protein